MPVKYECVKFRNNFRFAQVSFEDSEAANEAFKHFNFSAAAGEDASDIYKAFTIQMYVLKESEVIESARESWTQFKEKSKSLVAVRETILEMLQTHF
jgi:hypothetical protein